MLIDVEEYEREMLVDMLWDRQKAVESGELITDQPKHEELTDIDALLRKLGA